MGSFTWVPFYKELARKLLAYRDRQGELVALLQRLKHQGAPVISLTDRTGESADGQETPLSAMDPFTFFAAFNRTAKLQNRLMILEAIGKELELQAAVPTDLDGLPLLHPVKSRFFHWQYERSPGEIAALWGLADAAITKRPDEVASELFGRCLQLASATVTTLTMGLFWMRPDTYLSLDSRNCRLLDQRGVSHDVSDWTSYVRFLEDARAAVPETPYEFSQAAYVGTTERRYWVFQANPNYYDLLGALRANALKTWEVNQHRNNIHVGDKVIVWVSGEAAGCYALGTVSSEVRSTPEEPVEATFWKRPNKGQASERVALTIDRSFPESPVTRAAMAGKGVFRDFPAGRQGTNLAATKAHYDAILALATPAVPPPTGVRYWLYAPGPNARFWDECRREGLMVLGWDELGDFGQYASRDAIEAALVQTEPRSGRPTNDALAAWEFSRVVKPGDVVIAKQGRKRFLGYGVVTGPYRHAAERAEYRSTRQVDWDSGGPWDREADTPIALKALTDVTKYHEYIAQLKVTMGIGDPPRPKHHPPLPLNTILYGPPGTGKTWTLRNEYMKRFTEQAAVLSKDEFATELVADLAWWQVTTMVMLELKKASVSQMLAHPLLQARIRRANNRHPRAAVWAHLQLHTKADCPDVNYTRRYDPLLFWKDAQSVWTADEERATEEVPELLEALERYRRWTPGTGESIRRYEFTTFHQAYSYEDFVEGIKPVMSDEAPDALTYEVKPGVFRTLVQRALADPGHDYALLIDEISRGNVASIFGELITLIEDDKRQGADNELSARLPYSRDEFVVPRNLYLIGAMNTADRSVEALDTALRRRFTFVAVPPRADLVPQPPNLAVDLRRLLSAINDRLEKLLDKDHCIGHSYLMRIGASQSPLAALQAVFAERVIPLLEEYFYGDPAKIGMVLGEAFVVRRDDGVAWARGDWEVDQYDEQRVYLIRDPRQVGEEGFRAVYE